MIDISMPRLSDSMEEGTILKWLAAEGAQIRHGDELAEIETDKASMVYEADQERRAADTRWRGRHAAGRGADRQAAWDGRGADLAGG